MGCAYDVYLVLSRILSHGPHHPQQLLRRDGAAAILSETGSLCLQTFCPHASNCRSIAGLQSFQSLLKWCCQLRGRSPAGQQTVSVGKQRYPCWKNNPGASGALFSVGPCTPGKLTAGVDGLSAGNLCFISVFRRKSVQNGVAKSDTCVRCLFIRPILARAVL